MGVALGVTRFDTRLDGIRFAGLNVPARARADSTDFTWALEAGAMYQVSPTFSIGPNYRYMSVSNGSQIADDDGAHILRIKAAFAF